MTRRIEEATESGALLGTEDLPAAKLSTTVTVTATDISAVAASNKFVRGSGSWITDGFAVGRSVYSSGWTGGTANNRHARVITAVTATDLTFAGTDGDDIVDDAGGESVTVTQWEPVRIPILTRLKAYFDTLYEALNANLTAIAGLTSAADKVPYFTGSGAAALADLTSAGRALLDDASAAAQRETLKTGMTVLAFACSDLTTALTTGTTKGVIYNPFATAFNVVEVMASLATAQTSGSVFTVDINEGAGAGTSILSTKITIDNGDTTGGNGSGTQSATPAVISDASIAAFGRITADIDQIGDGTAKGLTVYLIGYPSA